MEKKSLARRYKRPFHFIRVFLLGNPLKSTLRHKERLGILLGFPILAVDAISSLAYATEEIFLVLMQNKTNLIFLAFPLSLLISLVMCIVMISYFQTVKAYPDGGGAYTVAKHNLGTQPSLIAASSLLLDYVLTVAVSVTAGIRALTSILPNLYPHRITLSIMGIMLLTWINLRGIRESAKAVAPLVYGFIVMLLYLAIKGNFDIFSSTIRVHTPTESYPNQLFDIFSQVGILAILLKAFSSGCTAMTGIEAVANAGSALAKPSYKVARSILIMLGACICIIFPAITFISQKMLVLPTESKSLLSLVAFSIFNSPALYSIFQGMTAIILFQAANTAYADFPRLSAIISNDGWLPKQLSLIGDRLVFSNGIICLSLIAIILVMIFDGKTHYLIPLYAVGVFSAFTLNQAGMFQYWKNKKGISNANKKIKMLISMIGTLITFCTLCVTFYSKFFDGAYIVLIIISIFVFICRKIHKHYFHVEDALSINKNFIYLTKSVHTFSHSKKKRIFVPINSINKGSLTALAFAREMSQDVTAIIVSVNDIKSDFIANEILKLNWGIETVQIESHYRSVVQPIVDHIHQIEHATKKPSVIVLSELVLPKWWQHFLHNKTASAIEHALIWESPSVGESRVVINVPYMVHLPD